MCGLLSLAAGLCSCSGTADDGYEVTISADKDVIVADGTDAAAFTVLCNGEDVTASDAVSIVCISSGAESILPAGTAAFSTKTAGYYTFTARYDTGSDIVESSNSVKVSAQEGAEPQDWYHTVLMMQFTSVGCINCPVMSSNLKLVQESMPERMAIASFHVDYGGYGDPMTTSIGSMYMNRFSITGLPQCRTEMKQEHVSSELEDLTGSVENAVAENLPSAGVSIESSFDTESRQLDMTLKVTSNVSKSYRYVIFLVEDGIEYMQVGADVSPYIHNNVVRASRSANIYGERLEKGQSLFPGKEVTVDWSTGIEDGWNPDNMRIVAAVLDSEDGGTTYICDNAAVCQLGGSIGYKYNE